MKKRLLRKSKSKKLISIVLLVLLVLGAVSVFYLLMGNTNFFERIKEFFARIFNAQN